MRRVILSQGETFSNDHLLATNHPAQIGQACAMVIVGMGDENRIECRNPHASKRRIQP